jgi:ribosomal protein L37AE/L43A
MSPTIANQAKLASIALAALLAFTALGSGTALAASPSEEECTACGGTLVNDSGTKICQCAETKKDVNGNANGTATQTTNTGQGNLDNKSTSSCTGNQGQCKQQ